MTGVEGMPFFERDEGDMNSLPAECYVAGFRLPGDDVPAARMTLPAELVDRVRVADPAHRPADPRRRGR